MVKAPLNIAGLAEYFGVSRTTVSYILNNRWKNRGISEATANRILEYVRETGFLPNPASLALKGRSVREIAILVPPNAIEHQKRAFFRLLELFEKSGKSYMMLQLSETHLADTAQFIKMYRIPRVIIIPTSVSWNFPEKWARLFRNLSAVDYFFYDFPFDRMNAAELLFSDNSMAVGIDREKARLKALLHILSKGYEHLLLPESLFDKIITRNFIDAYARNIRFDFYKMPVKDSIFDMGKAIVGELTSLMKKTGKPAAAYINDDLMSAAVMKCFREKKLSVPGDLAILSWDGLEESDYFITPLSTCVMPHEKMINTALAWIEGEKLPQNQMIFDMEIRKGKTLPRIP